MSFKQLQVRLQSGGIEGIDTQSRGWGWSEEAAVVKMGEVILGLKIIIIIKNNFLKKINCSWNIICLSQPKSRWLKSYQPYQRFPHFATCSSHVDRWIKLLVGTQLLRAASEAGSRDCASAFACLDLKDLRAQIRRARAPSSSRDRSQKRLNVLTGSSNTQERRRKMLFETSIDKSLHSSWFGQKNINSK